MKNNLTAQDIEIAVAKYFDYRANLIVPNVSWGWGLQHEADMIVLRPSGYCDEVEIKTTLSDIKADQKKPVSHWENRRIARVWFAVPYTLAECAEIPAAAGILSIKRGTREMTPNGTVEWRPWKVGDTTWTDTLTVVRHAKLREKESRMLVTEKQRMKLAELGAMRIWSLKSTLASRRHACL